MLLQSIYSAKYFSELGMLHGNGTKNIGSSSVASVTFLLHCFMSSSALLQCIPQDYKTVTNLPLLSLCGAKFWGIYLSNIRSNNYY